MFDGKLTPPSVASVGECMLELSGAGEDQWRMGYAGDTFNTLWTLRALLPDDWTTDYVSAFGDDPFSARQLAFFAEHGMGTAASPRIAGARPGLYAITLEGAERSFTYWRSDSAARRLADDPAALARSLAGRKLIYFSGITLAILDQEARSTLLAALRDARSGGSLVAFDPNYRARLWPSSAAARSVIADALAVADIALPTFSDEAQLFGDADPRSTVARLGSAGVAEIIVKDGPEAALVGGADEATRVEATTVSRPVDTTGAGDAFNGAYLAARLQGASPIDAAGRAHHVAGAVIKVRGALAPFDVMRAASCAALGASSS